jgi:putative peptidoglycan lipid II flippase
LSSLVDDEAAAPAPREKRRKGILAQSALTSVAAAGSILAGLLLDVVIAARFGAGQITDSFFVAARLPLGLVAIVMVGANQALVPRFTSWLAIKGRRSAWRLISILLTSSFLAGVALVGVVAIVAEPLMRLTAPGLSGPQLELAASTSRVMFAIVPLVVAAEIVRALLNSLYSFIAPAAMNVIMNGVAAGLVITGPADIKRIAWAYVIGAAAQLVFVSIVAFRRGFRFHASLRVRDPEIVGAYRLCVRPIAGASLNPAARVGEQLFASFLPPGAITISNYAYRLVSAVGGAVFFRSIIVTLVPRLTSAVTRKDDDETFRTVRLGMQLMLLASVPLTVFMAVLARPASQALFRRGSFDRSDATLLGITLAVYALSLVGSAVQRALLAYFFSKLDTRTPLRNTIYGVLANMAFLPLCMLPFGFHNRDAVIGIALAYSLAQYVNVAHAWARLRPALGRKLGGMWGFFARLCVVSGLSGAVMLAGYRLLDLNAPMTRQELLVRTAAVAVAGLVVLGALSAALVPTQLREIKRGRVRV